MRRWCNGAAAALLVFGIAPLFPQLPDRTAATNAFEHHEFSKASGMFEDMVALNSANFEAKLYLGRIALEERRFEEGVRWLEQAASGWRTNAAAFLWLGRGYGLQARAAGAPGGAGPARRARAAFEKAIRLDPDLIEAREGLVMFYREAPRVIGGGRKAALAEVEQIKKRDPYSGLLIHGDILMDARNYADAERNYQEARELKPNRVEASYRLGKLFVETRQFEKAFQAFDKILTLKPDETSVHYYIGKAGALSGQQLDRAAASLNSYLETKPWYIMPSLSAAHLQLAAVYERQGRNDAARLEYEAVLRLNPDSAEAKSGLRRLSR